MRARVRRRDVALQLRGVVLAAAEEGEHGPRLVARLRAHCGVVERAAVEARRRAGLEAPDRERQLAQARGKRVRRRIADATALATLEADVDATAEEGADRQHDGPRGDRRAIHRDDAFGAPVLHYEVRDLGFVQGQVGLRLE